MKRHKRGQLNGGQGADHRLQCKNKEATTDIGVTDGDADVCGRMEGGYRRTTSTSMTSARSP